MRFNDCSHKQILDEISKDCTSDMILSNWDEASYNLMDLFDRFIVLDEDKESAVNNLKYAFTDRLHNQKTAEVMNS